MLCLFQHYFEQTDKKKIELFDACRFSYFLQVHIFLICNLMAFAQCDDSHAV